MKRPILDYVLILAAAVVVAVVVNQLSHTTQTTNDLSQRIVGKTPEGFHRRDAQELCNALARANPGFKCVDPYTLPGYTMHPLK